MSLSNGVKPLSYCLSVVAVREGEQGEPVEVRRTIRYPDSQQLFVGNVPHDVDKAELKEFFERECPEKSLNFKHYIDFL